MWRENEFQNVEPPRRQELYFVSHFVTLPFSSRLWKMLFSVQSRLQEHLWRAKPEPWEMFSYSIAIDFSGRGLPEHLCGYSSVQVLIPPFLPSSEASGLRFTSSTFLHDRAHSKTMNPATFWATLALSKKVSTGYISLQTAGFLLLRLLGSRMVLQPLAAEHGALPPSAGDRVRAGCWPPWGQQHFEHRSASSSPKAAAVKLVSFRSVPG